MAGIPSRVESPNAYAAPSSAQAQGPSNYLVPLSVLTSLFFMWGGLTSLNDVLIPHLKDIFSLSYAEAMDVQLYFFGAYGVMSIPAGWFVKKIGFKKGIIVGLAIAATGCLLFYPAAAARLFGLFMSALFVLATGIVILQVAANPFVAVLGKPETASSRLTLTQAFNSLATWAFPTFIGPIILAVAGLSVAELAKLTPAAQQAQEAQAVQLPYVGLAIALAPAVRDRLAIEAAQGGHVDHDGLDRRRDRVWPIAAAPGGTVTSCSGAVAIFVYVGAEVAIGSLLVNYFKESYTLGLPEDKGAKADGLVLVVRDDRALHRQPDHAAQVQARQVAGGARGDRVAAGRDVGADDRLDAVITIIAVGLLNSVMFPTIFTLAIDGLGRHTEQGSGILCAAIVGGAVIPKLQGMFADAAGLHISFLLPAACYLYIAWYGLKGHAADAEAGDRRLRGNPDCRGEADLPLAVLRDPGQLSARRLARNRSWRFR